jgi:phage terminase Nu1 subunit (DNA packaging protein)
LIDQTYQPRVKQKDIAEALGLHKSVLSRYVRKGMPTHSVEAAKAWYGQNIGVRSRTDTAAPTQPQALPPVGHASHLFPQQVEPQPTEDFQAARTRREVAEANLAEMREAELQGKLIRVDVLRAQWAKRVSSTRDALLQIPSRLAPVLAPETNMDRTVQILEDELRNALAELTRDAEADATTTEAAE